MYRDQLKIHDALPLRDQVSQVTNKSPKFKLRDLVT